MAFNQRSVFSLLKQFIIFVICFCQCFKGKTIFFIRIFVIWNKIKMNQILTSICIILLIII